MVRITFNMRYDLQKLTCEHPFRLHFFYLEHAFRQRARLIEHKCIGLCKPLQIIPAFNDDPLSCGGSDPS